MNISFNIEYYIVSIKCLHRIKRIKKENIICFEALEADLGSQDRSLPLMNLAEEGEIEAFRSFQGNLDSELPETAKSGD